MSKPKLGTPWQESLPDELPRYMKRNISPSGEGCWLWNRSKGKDGYGWASYKNKTWLAHRLTFFLINGSLTDGLVIDHLCRRRECVNPDHMEEVTSYENILRSPIGTAGRDRCLACGGELVEHYGQRRCVPCYREYSKQYDKEHNMGLRRRNSLGMNSRSGYPWRNHARKELVRK